MNYYEKYIKYKNKYTNLKNKIGGGIEEYKEKSKPILQTIFTDIRSIVEYYYAHNESSKQKLRTALESFTRNCIVLEVRGNGACLLNAVCAGKYLMSQSYTIDRILGELQGFHYIRGKENKINYDNKLNLSITDFCISTYKLSEQNFKPITDNIMQLAHEKMGLPKGTLALKDLDFVDRMDVGTHGFGQLGQILSTVLNIVIISIDINNDRYNLNGIFPNGEIMSVSLKSIDRQNITENIMDGTWDIVFVINIAGRHYNTLIPFGEENIREINKRTYYLVRDRIGWN